MRDIIDSRRASATSSHTELRLVNVARASLEELLLDYEDYLRHRRLARWTPDSPEALAARRIGKSDPSDPSRLIPACPECGRPMTLRTAQKGKSPGKQFWGCTGYPECKKIAEI